MQSAAGGQRFRADWESGSAVWTFDGTKVKRMYGKDSSNAVFWIDPLQKQFFMLEEDWKLTQGTYRIEDESLSITLTPAATRSGDPRAEKTKLLLVRVGGAQ
ncbi:MAG: hypothetical protein AAF394_04505 [Planctomycetota bacterium]